MKKLLVIGVGAALAALASYALAQPTVNLFSGAEILNLTTGAGSGAQAGIQTINGVTATRVVATVGFGTLATTSNDEYIILTGATATGTVNLPNPASNGERIVVANGNNAISGTITAALTSSTTPQTQTLGPGGAFATTLAANSSIEYLYVWTSQANQTGTWYRVR
jgi:hypothetical protein